MTVLQQCSLKRDHLWEWPVGYPSFLTVSIVLNVGGGGGGGGCGAKKFMGVRRDDTHHDKLCVCSFLDDAFRKNLESALRFGNPLLVQVSLNYVTCGTSSLTKAWETPWLLCLQVSCLTLKCMCWLMSSMKCTTPEIWIVSFPVTKAQVCWMRITCVHDFCFYILCWNRLFLLVK